MGVGGGGARQAGEREGGRARAGQGPGVERGGQAEPGRERQAVRRTRRSAASLDHCRLRRMPRVRLSSQVGTVVTCAGGWGWGGVSKPRGPCSRRALRAAGEAWEGSARQASTAPRPPPSAAQRHAGGSSSRRQAARGRRQASRTFALESLYASHSEMTSLVVHAWGWGVVGRVGGGGWAGDVGAWPAGPQGCSSAAGQHGRASRQGRSSAAAAALRRRAHLGAGERERLARGGVGAQRGHHLRPRRHRRRAVSGRRPCSPIPRPMRRAAARPVPSPRAYPRPQRRTMRAASVVSRYAVRVSSLVPHTLLSSSMGTA